MKLFLNHSIRVREGVVGVRGPYGSSTLQPLAAEGTVGSPTTTIISMGYDCSPAQALRDMNLRKFALPFDWNISSMNSLERCFRDKFSLFHQNLTFNHNKTRLVDHYGFEFPHDYPILKDVLDCSFTSVVKEHTIVDNWQDYHADVCAKYKRSALGNFIAIIGRKGGGGHYVNGFLTGLPQRFQTGNRGTRLTGAETVVDKNSAVG